MIEVRSASADDMVLAFLRADVESPTERSQSYAHVLTAIGADKVTLLGDRADPKNPQQNDTRSVVLGAVRGYGRDALLFKDFPQNTDWRLVKAIPDEVKSFKYAKHGGCHPLLCSTRIVADGVKNLDRVQIKEIKEISDRVTNIADRLRQGERFPPLIAVQHSGIPDVVLVEGHTRATAYALTDSPVEIDVIIGLSPTMNHWDFF